MGTIVQQVDYLPYGEKCNNSTLISGENDYLYGGKEFQAPLFNIPWYDSQARFQTTDGIFVSLDPQCEKYYSISPYAYCAGNPVNVIDPDGNSTYVTKKNDNEYNVVDGGDPFDGDNKIYVVEKDINGVYQRTGAIIGRTATPFSFYDTDSNQWVLSTINMLDESAFRFTNYLVDHNISLAEYIKEAHNCQLYDFKETNFEEDQVNIEHDKKYTYRGMPVSYGEMPIIASARDVGNIAAGYMSAVNHIPYFLHRLACDYYQSITSDKGGWVEVNPITHDMTFKWVFEGPSSTSAQRVGWEIGKSKRRK